MLTKAHIEKVKVSEEVLDEVLNFKYIGGMIRAVGVMGEEMTYRLHENMGKGGNVVEREDDTPRKERGVV